jgi:hypothetical protein
MTRTERYLYPNPDKNTLMKSSTVFLILGIIIISVGLAWVISGGMAGLAAKTVPQTLTPAVTSVIVVETTAEIPVTTVPVTSMATEIPMITTAAAQVSGDNVTNHFLDIAYRSTNRLERLNYYSGQPRVVISAISAGDDDITLLEKTVIEFNDASKTVKLSENIKETGTGDILVKFLTVEGLQGIKLADVPESGSFSEYLTDGELYQGSTLAAKIKRGTIYINANLKEDARQHILVKSLMYEMGCTGETLKYPDSVFYATENTNVDFSPADKKAIAMLYEPGFYNGMTMDEIRRIIYLP